MLTILLMVPFFLTGAAQGYWFTFMSLAALMLLADLGFSSLVLQFAAHEFAFLRFEEGRITGSEEHLKKLSTFFVFCLKWAFAILLLALPGVMLAGFWLLSRKASAVPWAVPWVLYVLGSALAFLNGTVLYFFEGCDRVGAAQKIRVKTYLVMTVLTCGGLVAGLGLLTLSFSMLAGSLAGGFLIVREFKSAMTDLLAHARTYVYSWRGEFVPLFRRYAVSWVSGYFIFQMYTPVMFRFYGPVEAGRIGISITLWMGIFSFAKIWVYVVTPKLNMFASMRQWRSFDRLFMKSLSRSCLTFLAGAGAVAIFFALAGGRFAFTKRFVGATSMTLLGAGWFLQNIIHSLAVYLRAHKEEPLAVPSFVSAVYVFPATLLCARFLPLRYFFLGFLSSYLWGLPWIANIFRGKRRSHEEG
ncbi:MAG: hypothetical protein M0Z58_06075 [Nitrospiraceae bacterium]|nr:hypothetical protein [Nitrospiraceae bacterium]